MSSDLSSAEFAKRMVKVKLVLAIIIKRDPILQQTLVLQQVLVLLFPHSLLQEKNESACCKKKIKIIIQLKIP